jgi:hypothetical protein
LTLTCRSKDELPGKVGGVTWEANLQSENPPGFVKSCLSQPLLLNEHPSLPPRLIFPRSDPVAVSATGQSLLSGHGFISPYDYSSH